MHFDFYTRFQSEEVDAAAAVVVAAVVVVVVISRCCCCCDHFCTSIVSYVLMPRGLLLFGCC